MGFNLTNEYIDQTFEQLTQISGSTLVNGTGSAIQSLNVTASNASLAASASVGLDNYNSVTLTGGSTITLTKADGTSDQITISSTASVESASYASFAEDANTANSATTATTANTASYVLGSNVDGTVASATSATTATSASHAIIADSALTATSATSATTATSASHAIIADSVTSASYASTATSASHALIADNVSGTVTNATYASNTIVTGKNVSGGVIAKGTPLYFTGSGTSGNLVGVWPADASNPARMPAAGVAGEELTAGAEGVVLLDGFIDGVSTTGFQVGQQVYVGVGGGYQATRPTGSSVLVQGLGYIEKVHATNGSGVIRGAGRANDIPNLQQGYFFVGGAGDVGTTVASSSFAKVGQDNIFTGTQTFNDIAVNGTGSFAYLQSITGSAKIIGDSYIILNSDLPSERYAGIKVIDSGSGGQTGSLNFDAVNNDWFYEYSGDATPYGVALFGPEYATKGSPTYPTANTIQKGNGGHHLLDSSITDTGALVTVSNPLTVTGTITGNLTGNVSGNASTATTASYVSAANVDGEVTSAATASSVSSLNQNVDINGDLKVYGSTTLTGSLIVSASNNLWETDWPGSFQTRKVIDFGTITGADSIIYDDNFEALYNYLGAGAHLNGVLRTFTGGGQYYFNSFWQGPNASYWVLTPSGSAQEHTISLRNDSGTTVDARVDATNVNLGNTIAGNITVGNSTSTTTISGSVNVNQTIAGTITNATSASYAPTNTGDNITWTGNQVFSNAARFSSRVEGDLGTLTTSGAVSIDFSSGNFFTVTPSGTITLSPSNAQASRGQTVSVVIVNTGSHTVNFSGISWAGGTAPTITAGGTDVVTLVSFGTTVYGTAVQNLS